MVFQVRNVLHRSVYVNIRVTLASSTLEAEFREHFVKTANQLIFPLRFPCTKHQVTNMCLVEELVRNLDRFHVRHVAIRLHHQMHQSCRRLDNTHGVRVDMFFDSVSKLFLRWIFFIRLRRPAFTTMLS